MSLFFKPKPAGAPSRAGNLAEIAKQLGAARSSYINIDLSKATSAMQSIAIRSSLDLLCSLASELPDHVYRGKRGKRQQLEIPSYLEDPAGDGYGLADWAYQVMLSWLLRGNVYGDILETAPTGYPTQVALHYPDDVGVTIVGGRPQWTVSGRPVTDPDRFLHRRVNPVTGALLGLSPIAFHADQIGQSLASTRFGLHWFQDGAHPSGLLTNDEVDMSPDQARTAKERFLAALRGKREPLVLGKGWKWQQLQVTAEESQFLQTNGYGEAQCARIFGPGVAEVLGYESGGSNTYANVTERSAHLLVYTLNKWLRRLERLLSGMLSRDQYVQIDRDALLQSTTLQRYLAHGSALKHRWKTVNEVREDEELPPVKWGDEPNSAPAPGAGDGDKDEDDPDDGAEAGGKK